VHSVRQSAATLVWPTKVDQAIAKYTDAFLRILDAAFAVAVDKKNVESVSSNTAFKCHCVQLLQILHAYSACQRRDAAMATFISNHLHLDVDRVNIDDDVRTNKTRHKAPPFDEKLSLTLQVMHEQRDRLSFNTDGEWRCFVDAACLTQLLSVLDTHFAAVLVPSDAAMFHRCHCLFTQFAQQWMNNGGDKTLLRMAADKFNTGVYVRLIVHALHARGSSMLTETASTYETVTAMAATNSYGIILRSQVSNIV
jgi:hypothetical protein